MRIVYLILLAIVISSCGGGTMNKILKSTDPQYKLGMAEQFFVKGKYAKAQIVFEDILPYYKTGAEFENIYYKYAYCAFYQKDYFSAENLFKTFLELFPQSTYSEEVAYKRAFSFYKQSPKYELDQTNTIKTIGMMQQFLASYPSSQNKEEAQNIIDISKAKLETKSYKAAELYYDMGQFKAASVNFANLVDDYPESAKVDEYQLMVIKSLFRYAELSIDEKKPARYEEAAKACYEFFNRFPESQLRPTVEDYLKQSQINIKKFGS